MGAKLFKPELTVLKFEHDFAQENVASGATKNLGNLPTGFVIQSLRVEELEAVTDTSTIALGEDGGGDADGYLAATDLAASQVGAGALLYEATDKRPLEHKVADAKDGLLLTVGTADAKAGKIEVFVQGYQAN